MLRIGAFPPNKPDDPHNDTKNGDAPPLLNLGDHQKIYRAAQQCCTHRHIECQNRVWCKENTANHGKHQENCAENAGCHKIFDSETLFAGLIRLFMLILLFCNALTSWDRYAILWLDMANHYI